MTSIWSFIGRKPFLFMPFVAVMHVTVVIAISYAILFI